MSRSNTNQKGRVKRQKGQFLMLDLDLLTSPAWLALKPQERAVLVQVGSRYNGRNNGKLAVSVRDMERECRINKNTANKALNTLCRMGFLDRTREGSFGCKARLAAEYRLTWQRCDRTGKVPTRAFKHWRPPGDEPQHPTDAAISIHEAAWEAGC